jgi:hypothetical protein
MAYLDDIDQRFVRRGRFGPLDVYPQEERQREDELSSEFVKSGFKYVIPELLREFEYHGIYKDQPNQIFTNNPDFDNDVVKSLINIVNRREEMETNTQIEVNARRPRVSQNFRPSLILVILLLFLF